MFVVCCLLLIISCTSFYGLYHRVSAQPILTDVFIKRLIRYMAVFKYLNQLLLRFLKSVPMQRLKEINHVELWRLYVLSKNIRVMSIR